MNKSRTIEYYNDEIERIMHGTDTRMCLYYLDAIKEASIEDEDLKAEETISIVYRINATKRSIENYYRLSEVAS